MECHLAAGVGPDRGCKPLKPTFTEQNREAQMGGRCDLKKKIVYSQYLTSPFNSFQF